MDRAVDGEANLDPSQLVALVVLAKGHTPSSGLGSLGFVFVDVVPGNLFRISVFL